MQGTYTLARRSCFSSALAPLLVVKVKVAVRLVRCATPRTIVERSMVALSQRIDWLKMKATPLLRMFLCGLCIT
jgi:hypothetical protein